MRNLLVAFALFIVSTFSQTMEDDFVKEMPLWGKTSYDLYSGMLDADENGSRQLHYFFIESQNSPANDDMVIWLNGGPGCSSLLGMIQEIGPRQFKGIDEFLTNMEEFAWNKEANLLFIESPAGVGFSINNDKNYVYSDDNTATDIMYAYNQWLDRFQNSPVKPLEKPHWITGESYAGMYIPFFANAILDQNDNGTGPKINLKGFAIGNGAFILDWSIILGYQINTYVVQNFVNQATADQWYNGCLGREFNLAECGAFFETYMNIANNTDHYSVYNYTYSYEQGGGMINQEKEYLLKKAYQNIKHEGIKSILEKYNYNFDKTQQEFTKEDIPTPDGIFTDYFNREDVKKAMHVDPSIKWEMCNDKINYEYQSAANSTYLYPRFFDEGLDILIYSGNTDAAVQIKYTWACIEDLFSGNYEGADVMEVFDPWRQWNKLPNQQMGGMIQTWLNPKNGAKFSMAMVRAAGHEVPEYQPEPAYWMYYNFTNGLLI